MLEEKLHDGLEALGIELGSKQQQQLIVYVQMLERWNHRFNLTAIRDPSAMITRHILDSLSVLPFWGDAQSAIDVGTGGGLPGIPLAIALPGCAFTLLDSNGKKTRFLVQASAELQLANVVVEHQRAEASQASGSYEVVISRAFASLNAMIQGCHHLPAVNGRYLAMKGQFPERELNELDDRVSLDAVHSLRVPGLAEERCLVVLNPA